MYKDWLRGVACSRLPRGVGATAPRRQVPDPLRYSFYLIFSPLLEPCNFEQLLKEKCLVGGTYCTSKFAKIISKYVYFLFMPPLGGEDVEHYFRYRMHFE